MTICNCKTASRCLLNALLLLNKPRSVLRSALEELAQRHQKVRAHILPPNPTVHVGEQFWIDLAVELGIDLGGEVLIQQAPALINALGAGNRTRPILPLDFLRELSAPMLDSQGPQLRIGLRIVGPRVRSVAEDGELKPRVRSIEELGLGL